MVIFQLINEKEMRELEYHHFVSPKELMDIDLKGQATKVKKKKRQSNIMFYVHPDGKTKHYLHRTEKKI